jgi:hypothetical protein
VEISAPLEGTATSMRGRVGIACSPLHRLRNDDAFSPKCLLHSGQKIVGFLLASNGDEDEAPGGDPQGDPRQIGTGYRDGKP